MATGRLNITQTHLKHTCLKLFGAEFLIVLCFYWPKRDAVNLPEIINNHKSRSHVAKCTDREKEANLELGWVEILSKKETEVKDSRDSKRVGADRWHKKVQKSKA